MELKNRYYGYFLTACSLLNVRQDILAYNISKMNDGEELQINSFLLKFEGRKLSSEGTLYKVRYKSLDTSLTLANKVANIRNLRVNAMSGSLQAPIFAN